MKKLKNIAGILLGLEFTVLPFFAGKVKNYTSRRRHFEEFLSMAKKYQHHKR